MGGVETSRVTGLPFCADGFTVQPEDVVAVVGQMVQMDCQYGDTTSLSLDWEKDGTSILDGEDMFVHSNGTLQFNSVEVDDVGTYDCVVRTGFAQSFQCSAQLRLAGEVWGGAASELVWGSW